MSRFVPSDIRPTVVANADILYNCVMVDGPVLRVMMDGLGLDYPVVLVGGSFLCGGFPDSGLPELFPFSPDDGTSEPLPVVLLSFAVVSSGWASSAVGPEASSVPSRATELVSFSSSVAPAASRCVVAAELPSSLFPVGMACGQARARNAASRTAAVAIAVLFDFARVRIVVMRCLFSPTLVSPSCLFSIGERHRAPLGGKG